MFCMKLGKTGVAQSLDDMLHAFNVNELYCGIPKVYKKYNHNCCGFILIFCSFYSYCPNLLISVVAFLPSVVVLNPLNLIWVVSFLPLPQYVLITTALNY